MSVINQMLQDLEARGKQGQPVANLPPEVWFVPAHENHRRAWLGVLSLSLVLLALLALVWWLAPRKALFQFGAPAASTTASLSAPVPALVEVAINASFPRLKLSSELSLSRLASSDTTPTPFVPTPTPESQNRVNVSEPVVRGQASLPVLRSTAPKLSDSNRNEAENKTAGAPVAGTPAAATPSVTSSVTPPVLPENGVKLSKVTVQQQAENEYRKALAAQAQGRIPEAQAGLEQALQLDPQHTAARQTLVAWMVEQGRIPQAIQKLQDALANDPAQVALAIILARLQVDQGDVKAALASLQRSLPYVLGRAEYHAFLAALFQREQQHKEAINHYQTALLQTPENAVWWMGLGISLQAEQQKAAARDAFQRAKNSSALSPQLQAFVVERLNQLQ
jgi:MSHA biogenesis protein MshN